MTGAIFLDIAAALGGLGGLGVLVTWLLGRHKPKIDRRQAVVAESLATSEIRTADIEGLRHIIESLRQQVVDLQARVERAEGRARHAEREAMAAEEYVRVLLDHWPSPPPPPDRTHTA